MTLTASDIYRTVEAEGLKLNYGNLTVKIIILNLIFTLLLSLFIYHIYKKTFSGVLYSKSFNVTLVMVSIVTSLAVMVISGNLALSLGMVGALSIVRFRTAVKDPKDVGFLFWSITNGIICGVGVYNLAIISTLFIGLVVFSISKKITFDEPYLLILHTHEEESGEDETKLQTILKKYCPLHHLRSANLNEELNERIYEIKLNNKQTREFLEKLRTIRSMGKISLMSYDGELEEN